MQFRIGLLSAVTVATAAATEVPTGRVESLIRRSSEMALVSGGTFRMGLDDRELSNAYRACIEELGLKPNEHLHEICRRLLLLDAESTGENGREVYVSPFWIDRTEVIVAEYRSCVEAGACDPSPLVAGDTRFIEDALPIVNVTWFQASDYCAFQRKRLPTEAEWEKAARGTDGRRYPWGGRLGDDRANIGELQPEVGRPPLQQQLQQAPYVGLPAMNSIRDGTEGTAPPGRYSWGRSPYGVYDMAGNVSEWVADWYSESGYAGLPTIDPTGVPSGRNGARVVRGGSFAEPAFFARTYHRRFQRDSVGSVTVGFRCARDIR